MLGVHHEGQPRRWTLSLNSPPHTVEAGLVKSLLVFNEDHGVVGVGRRQPHGQESGYEGKNKERR